jgi:hypothetical protein
MNHRFGVLALVGLVLASPLQARAGGVVTTAHQLSISLHTLSQTTNSKGDDIGDKVNASQKDVFTQCVGTAPAKDEGIYLFMNCADLTDNTIAAIDTNPLFDTKVIVGSVDFQMANMVRKEKGGVLQSATVPVEIQLNCTGGTTTADVFGIMSLTFSTLGANPACPLSGKVDVIGSGHSPSPGNFIVNNGSAISVGKRSGAVTTFPPP